MPSRVAMLRPDEPFRPMLHEANCAGTGCEKLAFRTLGMRVNTFSMNDKKHLARDFISTMWNADIKASMHLYESMEIMTKGGHCVAHGKSCPRPQEKTIDLATQGLPCQPFSFMRTGLSTGVSS